MVPSTKKILKDLDELAATSNGEFERFKAVADDPGYPPAVRQQAVRVARDAVQRARNAALLSEQLRTGVIDRSNAYFREMYRR